MWQWHGMCMLCLSSREFRAIGVYSASQEILCLSIFLSFINSLREFNPVCSHIPTIESCPGPTESSPHPNITSPLFLGYVTYPFPSSLTVYTEL